MFERLGVRKPLHRTVDRDRNPRRVGRACVGDRSAPATAARPRCAGPPGGLAARGETAWWGAFAGAAVMHGGGRRGRWRGERAAAGAARSAARGATGPERDA